MIFVYFISQQNLLLLLFSSARYLYIIHHLKKNEAFSVFFFPLKSQLAFFFFFCRRRRRLKKKRIFPNSTIEINRIKSHTHTHTHTQSKYYDKNREGRSLFCCCRCCYLIKCKRERNLLIYYKFKDVLDIWQSISISSSSN